MIISVKWSFSLDKLWNIRHGVHIFAFHQDLAAAEAKRRVTPKCIFYTQNFQLETERGRDAKSDTFLRTGMRSAT